MDGQTAPLAPFLRTQARPVIENLKVTAIELQCLIDALEGFGSSSDPWLAELKECHAAVRCELVEADPLSPSSPLIYAPNANARCSASAYILSYCFLDAHHVYNV